MHVWGAGCMYVCLGFRGESLHGSSGVNSFGVFHFG